MKKLTILLGLVAGLTGCNPGTNLYVPESQKEAAAKFAIQLQEANKYTDVGYITKSTVLIYGVPVSNYTNICTCNKVNIDE